MAVIPAPPRLNVYSAISANRWKSAALVALGAQIADPLAGLAITLVILKITWDSWHTVRHAEIDLEHVDTGHHHDHEHD